MLGASSALGIRAKLIIPFVIILLAATVALGLGCWWKMKESLLAFQEAKGTLLTRTLATQIADPFSMGEYDQIQKLSTMLCTTTLMSHMQLWSCRMVA